MTNAPIYAGDDVILSRDQYEAMLLGAPAKTITVDAAEYAELVAMKPAHDALKLERDRIAGRLRELETCLRREQLEHAQEIEAAVKRIKQLGG